MDDLDFLDLLESVKQGDESACRRLVERYGKEVEIMVRRKLPHRLRSQFDTVDFTQVVWNSVLSNCREREEPFANPRHLLGFLSSVVVNKVTAEYRRRTRTQKLDVNREEPLYVRQGNREVPRDFPAPDPTPSERIQAEDRFDQLIAGRKPIEAEVLRFRREGLTFVEIGEKLEMDERSVRRVIDELRERMEERRWR